MDLSFFIRLELAWVLRDFTDKAGWGSKEVQLLGRRASLETAGLFVCLFICNLTHTVGLELTTPRESCALPSEPTRLPEATGLKSVHFTLWFQ